MEETTEGITGQKRVPCGPGPPCRYNLSYTLQCRPSSAASLDVFSGSTAHVADSAAHAALSSPALAFPTLGSCTFASLGPAAPWLGLVSYRKWSIHSPHFLMNYLRDIFFKGF